MIDLTVYGWSEFFSQQTVSGLDDAVELVPARVVAHHRAGYRVLGARGELWAEPSGRLRLGAGLRDALPTVGDWVAVAARDAEGAATIHAVYGRRSALKRKAAGGAGPQVLAANVDVVLVVAGLDVDPNLRRLERTLAAVWESGATPVVVLNKLDLCADPTADLAAAEAAAPGVDVHAVCALSRQGLDALRAYLGRGRSAALVGPSGVGKSTLTNALLGREVQATGATRAGDGKGRHTTTGRELLLLPDGGGCLIDTPGLRELGLWEGEVEQAFPEIQALARGCRFRDCRHGPEPGCAVQIALDTGELELGRYESYLKLKAELAFVRRKSDREQARDNRLRWKRIARSNRKRRKLEGW